MRYTNMNRSGEHNLFAELKVMSLDEYKSIEKSKRDIIHTYVIYIDGYHKIGSTKDIKARLSHYNTHCPPTFKVLHIINKQLEPILHFYYEKYMVKNDWFLFPENINIEKDITYLDGLVRKYSHLKSYEIWNLYTYKKILDENIAINAAT